MKSKLLSIMLGVILVIGLTGCRLYEWESSVAITRDSDGAEIRIGMHRNRIERFLEPMIFETIEDLHEFIGGEPAFNPDFTRFYYSTAGRLSADYNWDNVAWAIRIRCYDWTVAGEISLGDYIQDIIDRGNFEFQGPFGVAGYITSFEEEEGFTMLNIHVCDEYRRIERIHLRASFD